MIISSRTGKPKIQQSDRQMVARFADFCDVILQHFKSDQAIKTAATEARDSAKKLLAAIEPPKDTKK